MSTEFEKYLKVQDSLITLFKKKYENILIELERNLMNDIKKLIAEKTKTELFLTIETSLKASSFWYEDEEKIVITFKKEKSKWDSRIF